MTAVSVRDRGADVRTRARRSPRVVLALWAWRAALAAVVAGPTATLVRQAFPSPPRGDAVLWDPGGHALLVFVTREARGLGALALEAAIVLAIGAVLGIVPAALALVAVDAVDRRGAGARRRAPRTVATAMARLPALARLALGVAAAQAALVGAAYLVGRVADAASSDALGEAYAQLFGCVAAALFVPPVLALGIAHDLARASVVRDRNGALAAFFAGAHAYRRAPLSLGWAWVWRVGAGWVPVLAAATVAQRWSGMAGLVPVVAIAAFHQTAVVFQVAFHVSWLAKTLRSTDA